MGVLPLPQINGLNDAKGQSTTENYRFLQSLESSTRQQNAAVTALASDYLAMIVDYPEPGTYHIVLNAPFEHTITSVSSLCATGSMTATFSAGGVPLGGAANAVSTTGQTQSHSSANVLAAGSDLSVTFTAVAACEHATFMIAFTRSTA